MGLSFAVADTALNRNPDDSPHDLPPFLSLSSLRSSRFHLISLFDLFFHLSLPTSPAYIQPGTVPEIAPDGVPFYRRQQKRGVLCLVALQGAWVHFEVRALLPPSCLRTCPRPE